MSRFLQVVAVADAVRVAVKIAPARATETVPVEQSAGRVLAAPVAADTDIPGFDRSVVDGYAVRSSDTTGAGRRGPRPAPVRGTGGNGNKRQEDCPAGQRVCLHTDRGCPPGRCRCGRDGGIYRGGRRHHPDQKTGSHGENVLLRDEDFKKGEIVFRPGRRLTPQDAGVLAACGCAMVTVAKKPVVGIISTGNELVPVTAIPGPGQVRDANASMLAAWLSEYGCIPRLYGIVRDEREAFEAVICQGTS